MTKQHTARIIVIETTVVKENIPVKKLLCTAISLILLLSVCACTAQPTDGETAPEATAATLVTQGETAAPTESAPTETEEQTEPQLAEYGEPVIRQWCQLSSPEPCFQIMVPVKNISDEYIFFGTNTFTLRDASGNAAAAFEGGACAPRYLAPGQEGIIYYEAINRDGVDYLDAAYTLEFIAAPRPVTWDFEVLEVSDIQITKNLGTTELRGNLINRTDLEFESPSMSFLFFDEDGNILCAAYGSGVNADYDADDYGILHAQSTCPFFTYRYWMPDDYPLEKVTVVGYAFGEAQ